MKFNPKTFIGKDWKIAEEITKTPEKRDYTTLTLKTYLNKDEPYTTGEERLKRIKATGDTPLNADDFLYFWEHQDKIPEEWKGKYTCFFGTTLLSPNGDRYVLYLGFSAGEWGWGYRWLGCGFRSDDPSAVLASTTETPQPSDTLALALETVKKAGYRVFKEM